MPILISFTRIQRSNALSFAVAGSLALTLAMPEIDQKRFEHDDDLQIAQVKGKGKGKGTGGLGASRKDQHREQENAASGEDEEAEDGGGRRCPAGQSQAPLRGRGGSASPRGAGCM